MSTKAKKSAAKNSARQEETKAAAIKKDISQQLELIMQRKKFSKTQLAEELRTSRSALDRLLDPANTSVTLSTLVKAAHVLGKKLRLSFA